MQGFTSAHTHRCVDEAVEHGNRTEDAEPRAEITSNQIIESVRNIPGNRIVWGLCVCSPFAEELQHPLISQTLLKLQ